MNRAHSSWIIGITLLVVSVLTYDFYFGSNKGKSPIYNPAFDGYVSAYTEGLINRKSTILLRLSADQIAQDKVGEVLKESPFEFTPNIEGNAVWKDRRTLAFQPNELLPSGEEFTAKVDMRQLNQSIPDSLSSFQFGFLVKPQHIQVVVSPTEEAGKDMLKYQQVKGAVTTADFVANKEIEELFRAEINGEKLAIRWEHQQAQHAFVIDSVERSTAQAEVLLAWNGKAIGAPEVSSRKIMIPARGQFVYTKVQAHQNPDQYISIDFSDPLNPTQDLEGLIHLGEYKSDIAVVGNTVNIYPKGRLEGEVEVFIEPGIKNLIGIKTETRVRKAIVFDELKPQVELVGKGTILPSARGKLPFLFKAIGLNAVDIRIIKIYENNVPQFLQINNLDGSNELRRVGREILRKQIALDGEKLDLLQWNVHSLDLSTLIDQDPGAIYEVAIGYRKEYALCKCEDTDDKGKFRDMLADGSNWDTHSYSDFSYWNYYAYGYEYKDRNDPCLHAYYNQRKVQRRNILASNMGLIAKRSPMGNMQFIATNLQNTDPLSGVEIDVYNYQQQLMATGRTDRNGITNISMDKRPFIVVAKQGEQRGYLRLDDGKSLSLSRFDTEGVAYHRGLKGFIYGERGVWRPGDMMFLTFILEDEEKTLPANHPVIFELYDSRGQLVNRKTRTRHKGNFYEFHTATASDAPTGNYLAKVLVGGASFQKTLKVETVMPNRLKINFDFGKKALSAGESNTGKLEVKWLHGAIARNLKVNMGVTLKSKPTTFPKYGGYVFDDPARKFSSESKELFNGNVNEEGKAEILVALNTERASPGKLEASFNTKAFEPGGNFSVDYFSIPYHPYTTYVGIKAPKGDQRRGMLLTDEDHEIQIATVDKDGNPVTKSGLEVKLYKLDWKWWWDKKNEELADYRGQMYKDPIQEDQVSTVNGVGSWTLRINQPEWGRYLVRVCDSDEHCTGKIVYIDWPGWAGRGQDENPGGANMLMFSAEKTSYEVGEEITLNIPTGNVGRALISIESGQKVLETYWVNADKGTTRFSFTATPEMAPNIYANVMLLQPHQQTANDLPIRMYGVIPIKVEDPETKLQPMIGMKDQLGPMEDVTVRVSESEGRPMTYTVAVVDDGLLDLTRFKTPSPWNTFYQREALRVQTWDAFDEVIGAYGGKVGGLLGIGGDATAPIAAGSKQDRFKPVVMFMGPFTLEAGQTKNHTFRMPNYVGSVRTMVIAGNAKGAYGSAEKTTPVKKPLMALATLPRVIGPGESFDLPVTVFAMEEDIRNVRISVEGDDLIRLGGINKKNLRFTSTGEQMVSFSMKARASIGRGTVKVTATSGRHVAKYEVDLDVRAPNPRIVKVLEGQASSGENWEQPYTSIGLAGTNHGTIEVSALPPINMARRLQYLIRYPYGCIEQTTSSAFPQVYLPALVPLNSKQVKEVTANVKAAIKRLQHFQLSNGGFAYWPGNMKVNDWGTNYAGHFLLEAQKAGYSLPEGMLEQWLSYQATQARRWIGDTYTQSLSQSYRLYLLALAGKPELGAMNRMRSLANSWQNAVLWNLSAAYHLAGQNSVASQIASNATMDVEEYQALGGNYGSTLRDQAMILHALSIMGDRDKAKPLMEKIAAQLSSNRWFSTQTTAHSLLAVAKYVGASKGSQNMSFSLKMNNGDWEKIESDKPLWQLEIPREKLGSGTVALRSDSGQLLFARIVMDGIPQQGDNTADANGLSLNVVYKSMEGQMLNPVSISQGTDFKAEVTVRNTGKVLDYEELALAHIFPSGWEIHNNRLSGGKALGDKAEYQDIRDDRVYSFFDLARGESKTFVVLLNASYQGKFYMPTVAVEAMYDKSIHAHIPGSWVNVVE